MIAHFKKHFLTWIVLSLLILAISASYVRFMVLHDYTVQYEIDCDPEAADCFVGCEDDECTEVYYYSYIVRSAQVAIKQCGPDITDCEAANYCTSEELECEALYCEPSDTDECDEYE